MLLQIITHPVYITACIVVGFFGRNRRLGFVGFSILSFLLTPLVTSFFLFVAAEKPDRWDEDDDEDTPPQAEGDAVDGANEAAGS